MNHEDVIKENARLKSKIDNLVLQVLGYNAVLKEEKDENRRNASLLIEFDKQAEKLVLLENERNELKEKSDRLYGLVYGFNRGA